MPKKTVLIQMHKLIPKSDEIAKAIAEDYKDSNVSDTKASIDLEEYTTKLNAATTVQELGSIYAALPIEAKLELKELKDELKEKLTKKPPKPPIAIGFDPGVPGADEMVVSIGGVPITPEEVAELEAEDAAKNGKK